MITFEQFNFSEDLHKSISRLGFQNPTQIQEKSIPLILEGKDIVGESATGSGKTLAFGCGIVEKTIPTQGLQALILTPTRELAEQVKDSLRDLAHNKHLKIIAIYGGVAINPQIDLLRKADVVVATPGRFKDHLQRRTVDTSKISMLVLDEADRMLDMGFIDDIEMIIKSCHKRKQTLLFSATIPYQIEKLSGKYLHNPIKVSAVKHVSPEKLKQFYYDVDRSTKLSLLLHLIKNETSNLIMVFCNTRRTTDVVVKNLKMNHVNAIALHGGFSQNKRTKAIQQVKEGRASVLVCTDVASRGLDIENISHIYNYEIPNDPTDYVHRIGRTARAGEEGKVINLLCGYDRSNFSNIIRGFPSFSITCLEKPYVEKVELRQEPRSFKQGPRRRNFHHRGRR